MAYRTLTLDDPALVVSDLHCRGVSCGALEDALAIAREEGAVTLAVLGDLFDDFHEPVDGRLLQRYLARMFERAERLTVVYVTSCSSHDPLLPAALRFSLRGREFYVCPGGVAARLGRLAAFLTHGDIIVRNGAHAFLINAAMRALGKELFLEKRLRQRLRLPSHWWLFMGHTHLPGIDCAERVANAGSWREEWFGGLPYWRPPTRTYIWVEGGRVELKRAGKRFLRPRIGARGCG